MPQGSPEGLETLQDQQVGLTQAVFTFLPPHRVLEHVRYFISPPSVGILFPAALRLSCAQALLTFYPDVLGTCLPGAGPRPGEPDVGSDP